MTWFCATFLVFVRSLLQMYITYRDEQLALKNKQEVEGSSSNGKLAHHLASVEQELARIKSARLDLLWKFIKVVLSF